MIDRDTASRLGVTPQDIDNALYDAFGQRQVSTIYRQLNQYHVVMEVDPQYQSSPETLNAVYMHSSNGQMIPLATIARFTPSNSTLAVNHQGQFPAVTLSFNLAQGVSLGEATQKIEAAEGVVLLAVVHGRKGRGESHGVPPRPSWDKIHLRARRDGVFVLAREH